VTTTRQPETLLSRIRDLERQIRELRRGTLSNATISQGGLEVRTPDGFLIARIGEFDAWGTPATGMEIYRRSGGLQARFFDTTGAGGGGYWALFDEAGEILASEDTVSGSGLATPYIDTHPTPYSRVLTPPESTTNGTFTPLWRIHHRRQHPRIFVRVIAKTDGSTSGEVRLNVDGTIIAAPITIPVAANGYYDLHGNVPGALRSIQHVDVEARRTAGAGTVAVEVAITQGVQS